jgi:hypothetical protein
MVLHYPDDRLTEILNQGGVTWLRTSVLFEIQPKPGSAPVWGETDRVAAAAARRGQQLYLGLSPNYPGWITRGMPVTTVDDDWPRPRPRPGDREPSAEEQEAWRTRLTHWENFVRQVVGKFGPLGVTYFNIGNEPNDAGFYHYGAADYINQLVIAARVIHTAGYKVCAPDITSRDNNPFDFLRLCLKRLRDERIALDVVTIHGYPRGGHATSELLSTLYQIVPILREYGISAPVWLTETGVDNTLSDAMQNNGQRVKEICSWIGEGTVNLPSAPWRTVTVPKFLKKVFFFVWSDDLTYGWLDSNRNPKPHLWDAYRSVTGK